MNKLLSFKSGLRLLASLLLLCLWGSPSSAGQWELDGYYWSGSSTSKELVWSQDYRTSGKYETRVRREHDTARNQSAATASPSNRIPGGTRVSTIGQSNGGEFVVKQGIAEDSGEVGASVYARFNWRRNMAGSYDEATGNYSYYPDPADNPPSHIYVREQGSISAGTNIQQIHGNWTGYSLDRLWMGDYYTITGSGMGLELSSRSRPVYDSVNSWQYGPSYKTVIREVAVSGDSVVVPSRSFSGEIKVSPGYENEIADQRTSASLGFGYEVDVADTNFSVSAGGTFTVQKDTPNEKELDAFISRGWRVNDGDTPEDAARQFWSGGASYSASVRKSGTNESFFTSPNYNWANEGEGSLFTIDEEVPNYDRSRHDISVSSPTKDLTHDFGEITAENLVSTAKSFPKSSTVTVEVTGDEGGEPIKNTGTINWHVPFATVFEVAISLEVELPEGETLDLSEVPDEDFWESDDAAEWADVEKFTSLRKGSPRLWLDTTNEVGKQTFVFFATEAATRGVGRLGKPVFRALEASQVSRGLQKPMSRFMTRNLVKFNSNRAVKGKMAAKFKPKITTTNKGTVGTVDPREIPKLPKWWVAMEPIGSNGNRSVDTTTSPAPEDGGGSTTTVDNGNTVTTINGSTITTTREGSNGTGTSSTTGTTIVGEGEVGTTWVTPDPPKVPDGPNLRNPVWLWPSTGTTNKGTESPTRPELEIEKEGSKDTIIWDEEPKFRYWFYTSDPTGFISRGTDRWVKSATDGNPLWPTGYYFTKTLPLIANTMTRGAFSFKMWGHPYGFGSLVWAVPVEFDLPLPSHAAQHQGALGLFRTNPGGMFALDLDVPAGGGRVIGPPVAVSFQAGEPGKADVPRTSIMPAGIENVGTGSTQEGTWDGQRGNSGWMPRSAAARVVAQGQRIPFVDTYPDFPSDVVFFSHPLDLQRGTHTNTGYDFEQAGRAFARTGRLKDANGNVVSDTASATAIANAISNMPVPDPNNPGQYLRHPDDSNEILKGYTWHHHEDMRTMELIATHLHGDIKPHQGGKSYAEKARW